MNIKPLGDRVLVKLIKQEDMTASGIVLPETSEKERKAEGVVVSVGEGEDVKELNLQPGDKVIFGKYAGDEVEIEKEQYKILKDDEVLAKME